MTSDILRENSNHHPIISLRAVSISSPRRSRARGLKRGAGIIPGLRARGLKQRGTKDRITGAKYDAAANKWTIDIEVIGQLQRDFVMKMGSGGYYCEFL